MLKKFGNFKIVWKNLEFLEQFGENLKILEKFGNLEKQYWKFEKRNWKFEKKTRNLEKFVNWEKIRTLENNFEI